MKILLDTHIALWLFEDNPKLSKKAREILLDESNDFYFSIASAWEITIKYLRQKHKFAYDGNEFAARCKSMGIHKVDITLSHISSLKKLHLKEDAIPHQDPFDRILIAQAMSEDMYLLTSDTLLSGYDEPCVKVV